MKGDPSMTIPALRGWGLLLCASLLLFLPSRAGAAVDPELAKRYQALAASVDPQAMARTIQTLSTKGSRVVGYPGERFAADYVQNEFNRLFGPENVRTETFQATVPMDKGATLSAGGKSYKVYSVWPNLVRTSQLPPGRPHRPADLRRQRPAFRVQRQGRRRLDRARRLQLRRGMAERPPAGREGGRVYRARPHDAGRSRGEVHLDPDHDPRFYIKKSEAAALQALALGRKGPQAALRASMVWERVPARNFVGILPGQSKDPKIARQIIVVQSYYDAISVVPALAPGAESAGGIAGLLQAARTFKKFPPERTVWFVATSGHYLGLQGVREFVHNHIDKWQVPGPFAKLFGPRQGAGGADLPVGGAGYGLADPRAGDLL
jgi:hypothetical protein